MKFLSNVLATIVGIFLFCCIFFFGLLLISALFSSDGKVSVKENSVLEINLEDVSYDYAGKTYIKDINYFDAKHNGVTDIINAIKEATKDENIKGISLLNNKSQLGLAQTKAVRDALQEFKKSKKFVYAYADYLSQGEFYLASVADKLYLNPAGELEFKGLSSEVIYMKDLQEKSGIKMEVIRHGKYKSAVEPFLNQEMSAENREQLTALLQSVWSTIAKDISNSRNISVDELNIIADSLKGRTPVLALQNKLIDKIAYEDEYHNLIKKELKTKEDEDYETIDIIDYARNIATSAKDYSKKDIIAVIYAQGEIASGEGEVNVIGEGSIKRALKDAREDEDIKAIVLRVNSPGGSALTSELIWREIEITKKTKPVVVSMGNYAASGGYYIAAGANRIFAEPNTITGSIGVFGVLPNMTQLSKNIGINAEQVKTHAQANGYSVFEPLDNNFKNLMVENIETIYTAFLEKVDNGRKMTTAQVDSIAQGRVWTGVEAKNIGLVDEIGGLDSAIKYAAILAKTKSYKTENFPEYETSLNEIFGGVIQAKIFMSKEEMLKNEIGTEGYALIEKIKRIKKLQGAQAWLPYEISLN